MNRETQASQRMTSPSDLLLPSEVAKMFRVSERTLSRWVSVGEFPQPLKVGNTRRWKRSDLDSLIQARSDHDV